MHDQSNHRSVLIIAFHFPPCGGGSGMHRTVSLTRHLPALGWNPIVVTTTPKAHGIQDAAQELGAPTATTIRRARAFDARRWLSVAGRYPAFLAVPDRWLSWLPFAYRAGRQLIEAYRPSVIMSTYPIATAHLIAWTLARRTGLPWVADFRDPMVENIDGTWYPVDRWLRQSRLSVERLAAKDAHAATFCTESSREIYVNRYLSRRLAQLATVIENGFDPADFERAATIPSRRQDGFLHLVHSGTLYPGPDRDPTVFLRVIATSLKGIFGERKIRITLRATGHDQYYCDLARRLGLDDLVHVAPALPHHDALREVLDADGLLLFQGRPSNPAIPAKAYEYLRAGRPILAMTDRNGETARFLRAWPAAHIAQIDEHDSVQSAVTTFAKAISGDVAAVSSQHATDSLSRSERAAEFACLFEELARSAQ